VLGNINKKILRDAFANELPKEILNRSKHGFEVPMNKWFKTNLKSMIDRYLLSYDFIENQGLFRHDVIRSIVDIIMKNKYHDLQSMMWCLLVFQHWYMNYESKIKKDWKK
jgi:asparagine synthase (glutamine-hydrolysing)